MTNIKVHFPNEDNNRYLLFGRVPIAGEVIETSFNSYELWEVEKIIHRPTSTENIMHSGVCLAVIIVKEYKIWR